MCIRDRIKVPLVMEVGLGTGHIVLDGTQFPHKRDTAVPTFRPISVVAKWLDGSGCHGGRLGPGDIVLDWDPALPHGKGHSSPPPLFGSSVVARHLTMQHVSSCLFLVFFIT